VLPGQRFTQIYLLLLSWNKAPGEPNGTPLSVEVKRKCLNLKVSYQRGKQLKNNLKNGGINVRRKPLVSGLYKVNPQRMFHSDFSRTTPILLGGDTSRGSGVQWIASAGVKQINSALVLKVNGLQFFCRSKLLK